MFRWVSSVGYRIPRLLAVFFFAGGCAEVLAQGTQSEQNLKRILPASAAPEGSLEVGLFTEYSTLDFGYEVLGRSGEEREFIADDYHSWTTELQVDIGLIEDFELSIMLPVVYASFQAAERDRLSERRTRDATGIGDAEVAISYGWESEDETLLALLSLGVELPTNTLGHFFGGASTAGVVGVEVEKYFGPVGIVGGVESKYDDENQWEHEYLAGFALLPSENFFAQLVFGRAADAGTNRVELSVEYLVSERCSLEWMVSREFSDERETIVGLGVSVFFGEEELDEDE